MGKEGQRVRAPLADVVTPVLLFGFMLGAAGAAIALAIRYRRHAARTRRILEQDDHADLCVACSGTDVSELGPDAYRCKACGFTWGSGLAALRADTERAAIAAMSDEERRRSGMDDLAQAKLLLLAAVGAVEAALAASRDDLAGYATEASIEKHPHITRALSGAREAREHIIAAKNKFQGPSANTLRVLDVEFIDFGSDHYLFDGFDFTVGGVNVNVGDEKIHRELEKLEHAIRAMLSSVERALVVAQQN
jgi:hypothetical protein